MANDPEPKRRRYVVLVNPDLADLIDPGDPRFRELNDKTLDDIRREMDERPSS